MGFNAFKYVDALKEAGVPDKQAEVQVRILHEVVTSDLATKRDIEELKAATKRDIADVQQNIEELKAATKRDIEELKAATKRDIAEVKRDIAELRAETQRSIKELEQRMVIKLGSLLFVTLLTIVALSQLKLIF